jgi:hypothetical protein
MLMYKLFQSHEITKVWVSLPKDLFMADLLAAKAYQTPKMSFFTGSCLSFL